MAKTYDLVIIGSGTTAQVASARVRAAGWEIAVIDHRPFGGTCALRGCDPKKMLISGAEAIDAASAKGIDTFHGLARFTGHDAVAVEGQELKARHILIAAGARPVPLGIPGEEHVVTSDRFLELNALPARIAFVGGGYIAA